MRRIPVLYIEGDGVGSEITPVMIDVLSCAVDRSYGGDVVLDFEEVLAGNDGWNPVKNGNALVSVKR